MEKCAGFLDAGRKDHNNEAGGCRACTWWLPAAEKCAFQEKPADDELVHAKKQFNHNKTSEFLKRQGILPHLKGYYFLMTALEELTRMPANPFFHREVYERVAERFNTNPNVIERSISGAIKSAWLKGGLQDNWHKPPSPRVLIKSLADMLDKETE